MLSVLCKSFAISMVVFRLFCFVWGTWLVTSNKRMTELAKVMAKLTKCIRQKHLV